MVVDLPPGTNIHKLIDILRTNLPAAFTTLVLEPLLEDKTKAPVILLINQKQLPEAELFNKTLEEGDEIVFLPPMEGG